jgi:hypothetical protein
MRLTEKNMAGKESRECWERGVAKVGLKFLC